MVLKLLAQGVREWGRLKLELERIEGHSVSDRVLRNTVIHSETTR